MIRGLSRGGAAGIFPLGEECTFLHRLPGRWRIPSAFLISVVFWTMEWLFSPIDPSRAHFISAGISWHARVMLLAWGVLAPAAILVARFFKITPHQDWPRVLDNPFWWRTHWITQSLVICLSAVGLVIIVLMAPADSAAGLHRWLGYTVLVCGVFQGLSGYFRGSKGGPADGGSGEIRSGDHYNMTPWRLAFETVHKSVGYLVLPVAAVAIISGLWSVNGPVWMWMTIFVWWGFLIIVSFFLQTRGYAVDTYQAIWGPDPGHPGNQMKLRGWKMRRPDLPPRRGGRGS